MKTLDGAIAAFKGALANLGYELSKTTVVNILRAKGIIPAPEREKKSNWKQFVRSHMATMCVADFLTVEVWTMTGLVRYHVLFVMNLAKRKVHIAHIGCQVNGQVMAQVARNLTDFEDGFLSGMEYFVCDNDPLFTKRFEQILDNSDVDLIRTRVATPQQNGFAERFVKSIKTECLDNLIPFPYAPRNEGENGSVVKFERLGGLLNYYSRESESSKRREEALTG
jgi:transposase InsO family protein